MQELPADVKQKKNIFLSAANDCDTKYFCRWRHMYLRRNLIARGEQQTIREIRW